MMRPWLNETALQRFLTRFEARGPDECWPWIGSLHGRDRGRFQVNGTRYSAPAFAWMVHHRDWFPAGMEACHECDNPVCVNPTHIWPGTHLENMRDCIAKGRARKNPALVAAIRLAKPLCGNGHARDEVNTYIAPSGRRRCRICDRIAGHARTSKTRRVVA